MQHKRTLGILVVILLAAMVVMTALAGCGGGTTTTTAAPVSSDTTAAPTESTAPATTSAPAGGYTFGRSNPVASNQLLIAMSYGSDQMAKALGDKVQSNDANLSPDKQVADIDTFITMKVNGLISWTLDQGAATAAYTRAQAAGIPVITENSPGDAINTMIVTEDKMTTHAAEDSAKYIAERIPGAKILVIGGPPVPYIMFATDAMQRAAKAAGLTVLERQDNVQDVSSGSQPIVQSLLTKYPDVQAVWCYNDPSALGASAAIRAAGKDIWQEGSKKGIILIGMNGAPDAIDAIKSGY
ncbi:MAG: sugar ABC transporter substrate-binding protein, partial [Actinobacteria bacterium]|nr:sugar ABC transporter substrate-binding protein [Actinomycetota bacterium]